MEARKRQAARRPVRRGAATAKARTGRAGRLPVTIAVAATGGLVAAGVLGHTAGASVHAAPRAKVVPLVVYSAQGYDKAETQAFQKRFHVPVELDDNSTGPLLTQIEASKDNPRWGLLWVDGDTAFAGLDTQRLLMRGFEPKVAWTYLGKEVVPSDGSYVPTGITLGGAMAYDAAKVKNPPTTWSQLLATRWKGQIGTNDPTQSGPTYPFVAGIMRDLGGVQQGEAFFSKLKANGLVINPTNGPTLSALGSGQINIALVQSSAAIGAGLSDKGVKVKYLDPVPLIPSCIGIDAKAPRQEQLEAEEFVNFVLSPAGQKVMQTGDPTGDSLYYPVIAGVKPLPALPPLTGVHTVRLNPYLWGNRENSVNAWFEAHIVQ